MEKRTESPNPEALQQQISKQEQQIAELSAKLKWYEEQFRLAQQKRFGASSEKTHPDQLEMNLFNEAEVLAASAPQEPDVETVTYSRKKTSGTVKPSWISSLSRRSATNFRSPSKYARAAVVRCMR